MFLHIEDDLTIGELQERFTECFPQLSIVFYSQPHKGFASSDERYRLAAGKKIGDVRKNGNIGSLEIKSWHTVSKVETELRELYGLNAQVFRRGDKGKFVQTTLSDRLTLKEQSELSFSDGANSYPAV